MLISRKSWKLGRKIFTSVLCSKWMKEIRKAVCTGSQVLTSLSQKGRDFLKMDTCLISSLLRKPSGSRTSYVTPVWARRCGRWLHFPAHIALCRSLCSRMVVPGWPSVALLQHVSTHRVPQMLFQRPGRFVSIHVLWEVNVQSCVIETRTAPEHRCSRRQPMW